MTKKEAEKAKRIKAAEAERNKEAAYTMIRQCEQRGYYNMAQRQFIKIHLPEEAQRLDTLRRD